MKKGTRAAKEKIRRDKTLSLFEKAVYLATLLIPPGRTRSYKWVAKKCGYPKASRAVGNALNKNPYIGIVPCHRVIKSDGSLGGFAKGKRAKLRLLRAESKRGRFTLL